MNNNITREKTQGVQRVIIVVLAVSLILAIFLLVHQNKRDDEIEPGRTAVIQTDIKEELSDTSDGQIRVKINPVVDVEGKTMNNLNFANYNEGRLLRCKILSGEQYIYDSGLIEPGDMLIGDFIQAEKLSKGLNEAIAEIYSYDMTESPLGQTNVKITLNLSE